jgi:DNA-binding IclR family transcriptional regulator
MELGSDRARDSAEPITSPAGRHHGPRPRPLTINRSVARALRLLLDVAHGSNSLSFAEFQTRHKLPKATLHKLLATLESMHFLRRDPVTGKYSIGVAALEFSSGGEEVMLQRLDPPNQIVRIGAIIAHRHPAYATAGGLAALAVTPDKSCIDSLPAEFPPRTKNTVKTREELLERLDEIREKGYSLDLEEAYLGVRCVGVAVAVPPWPVVHVSFTLPLQRAPLERLRTLAKPLMAARKEIQKILSVTTPRSFL